MGYLPRIRQRQAGLTRQPVVRVDQVVGQALGLAELLEPPEVLRNVPVETLLGLVMRPGLKVDDPGIIAQADYLRVVGVVGTGIDATCVVRAFRWGAECTESRC